MLIGIVAGEASGDELGAGLMQAIKVRVPSAQFVGVGGDKMLALGFESLAEMERLSVMGILEPLKRLPELIAIRRRLKHYFIQHRPAIVIGIDSPDFNIGLEKSLKSAGIITCHYVCPSVWAWRQSRVKKIKASIDHVLALLPFEVDFLTAHGIPATFVGHPMVERLAKLQEQSGVKNQATARQRLNLPTTELGQIDKQNDWVEQSTTNAFGSLDHGPSTSVASETLAQTQKVLCVLPGSRMSELEMLLETFVEVASICLLADENFHIVIPAATEGLHHSIRQSLEVLPEALQSRITLLQGDAMLAMQAADVVLLASGTATLEAALLRKPMVIAYKLSPPTYWVASKLVKVEHIGLPNLLAGRRIVPELIQHEASAENLAKAVMHYFSDNDYRLETISALEEVGKNLSENADEKAAEAILSLVKTVN